VRAAVVVPGARFDVVDLPDPTPGPGELLLRVTACGLCGSDQKARMAMPEGTVMGHEFGGEVVGLGAGVTGWKQGTQVAVLPVIPCGECDWCQAGFVIYCAKAQLVGLGGVPGGFAEYAVVTPLAAFPMPQHVDPLHSALVEPFVVGLHAVRTAELKPGADVLVIGAGSVGLTSLAWARLDGANRITAVDPVSSRRDTAVRFGATDTLDSVEAIEANAYDLVIECVGKPGLLDRCVTAARPRSQIVVAGVCIEPDPFQSIAALMKEVSIRFAVYYTPQEYRTAIDAIADGRVDAGLLLSHQADLAQVNEAFEDFTTSPAAGKVLLQP
jgi:(R,R)-butanediol dehydrogenase / meso-butanediol dehydrogenase / diacetyl reductase